MKWIVFIVILLFGFVSLLRAQPSEKTNELIEESSEKSIEEITESNDGEIPEELQKLNEHPVDINSDEIETLLKFQLITVQQSDALKEYRIKSGKLIELEELQQINYFDKKTIQSILPFCTVHDSKQEKLSQQATFRFQKPLEKSESYTGPASKLLFKYKCVISQSLSFSYTGEKDAGEEMFTKETPAFDFNSFNITYKGNKLIRKIIIGDFNIESGQGLTCWTGLSFGGGINVTGLYKFGRGIIPYSGTDENRFMRGAAISLENKKWKTDFWASHHAIDGNKESDTLSKEDYFTSLQTSGYHRTDSEKEDFHSQKETIVGGSFTYIHKTLRAGIVANFQKFQFPVRRSDDLYSKYNFDGTENSNAGFNYSYTYKNIFFFGENAIDRQFNLAILNGVLISADARLGIGILYRSYSKEFISLKSNAFGANTAAKNETGNYLGINYKLHKTLNYSGYVDLFQFPFLKYRVDYPSHGFDFFHQLEFTPTRKFSSQFKYRKRLKQLNDSQNDHLHELTNNYYESIRFSARFKIDNTWEYAIRTEISIESTEEEMISKGTAVSQDLFFHPMGKPISVNFRYSVFNCPQFNTRIYGYENDVQGAFSLPFYYGSGSRFYINVNYKILSGLALSVRYGISWFDSTDQTSSSDLKVQVKVSFR
jgi:hypothetical protein